MPCRACGNAVRDGERYMDELTCAVALSIISSPATHGVWAALARPSAGEAFARVYGAAQPEAQEHLHVQYHRDVREAAIMIAARSAAAGSDIISFWDESYPAILREIAQPPVVLYVRGRILARERIAVVGTRKADPNAREHARRISGELADHGFVIVSGMAAGIDREAHCAALARGAPTIGVLANGIDLVYPAGNRDVGAAILASGNSALVSEHPPGIKGIQWGFVRRNRIVSGLARATVVIQAGEGSGALITARHALEQNREVFACPGPAFDQGYAGCHALIKNGANLAAATDDILRELASLIPGIRLPEPVKAVRPGETDTPREPGKPAGYPEGTPEAGIIEALRAGAMETDRLIRVLEFSAGRIQEALMGLELEGRIERFGTEVRVRQR